MMCHSQHVCLYLKITTPILHINAHLWVLRRTTACGKKKDIAFLFLHILFKTWSHKRLYTTFFTYATVLPKTYKLILMFKIGEVTL